MWRLAGALLLLGGASGLGFAYSQANRTPKFITASVERGSIANLVHATGTMERQVQVNVSSHLSGQVSGVFVDFNDVVKAGQPLARLDQETFVAQANEA